MLFNSHVFVFAFLPLVWIGSAAVLTVLLPLLLWSVKHISRKHLMAGEIEVDYVTTVASRLADDVHGVQVLLV